MAAQSALGQLEAKSVILWVWENSCFTEAAETLKLFGEFKGKSLHIYTVDTELKAELYNEAKAIIFFAPTSKIFDGMVDFVLKNTKIKYMEGAIWGRTPPERKIKAMEARLNGGQIKYYERTHTQRVASILYLKYIKRTVWWARRTPEWQAANPQRCQTKKRSALPREDEVVIEGSEPAPEGEESFPTPSSPKKEEASSPPPANTSLDAKSVILWVWDNSFFKEAAETLKLFGQFKGKSLHVYSVDTELKAELYNEAKAIIFFAPTTKIFDGMVDFVLKNTKIKFMEGAVWGRTPPNSIIRAMEARLNGGQVKFYERSHTQRVASILYLKYIKRTIWWARRTPEWQAANPQSCQTRKRSALPREDEVVIGGFEPSAQGKESTPTPSSSKKDKASSPPPANTSLTEKEGGAPKGRRVRQSLVRG